MERAAALSGLNLLVGIGFPLTKMSNKSPFGSASHLANEGSWRPGSPTSNPQRLKAESRLFFIASRLYMETWGRHRKIPQQMALETTKPKNSDRNFTVTGMSMSCLDRARTANLGTEKFTTTNHSNPSLVHNSIIDPDDFWAGLWLPTQEFTFTDSLISSWVECSCNSIAAAQTLPVRFVRPIFHGQTHCAHAFGSFVWYSARFFDMPNSGFLPEWKEICFTLYMSSWAILKRSFISQGRKELLTPPLTPHLRGHSASLHDGIPVFCLRRLAHLTTCGGFIAWLSWLLSNCLRILSRNASQWEQVNLSTGLIH